MDLVGHPDLRAIARRTGADDDVEIAVAIEVGEAEEAAA
jgi:hypothetical protein